MSSNTVVSGGHPAWSRPSGPQNPPQLVVRNSLTDTKEPFIPAEGNIVRMYVCGPTVYSVSHMGHARTFLCFDILRRILEKYFRFNVLFQMNITDIDDKIILAARKNALVKNFKAKCLPWNEVNQLIKGLVAEEREKLQVTLKNSEANKPSPDSREFVEFDTQLKQLQLKIDQVDNVINAIDINPSDDSEALIDTARDILANHLDKIEGASIQEKAIFEAHSRYYEAEFLEDCKALNIREPDVLTRVTEYVDEIVTFIQRIQDNGFAYESNGSVYFDTERFKNSENHSYPKLVPHAGSGATDAEIAEGEGALSGTFTDAKRHRNDFALWKKSKAGEPRWDSPWGQGRPGWHIECSVMATAIHGQNLDVHGGGVDLKFPHHDNEIAQTEAHFDIGQWTNYFLHAGHLHIKGLKMAKSLKNFITIREALSKFSPKQIRIMFLLQQWDKPVNFSDQTLNEAKDKDNRINSFLARVAAAGRNFPVHSSPQKWDAQDNKFAESILAAQERVHVALCDNFDTPAAMEALESCISCTNQYFIEQTVPKYPLLLRASDFVRDILSIFGVVDSNGASEGASNEPLIEELVAVRDKIRELAGVSRDPSLLKLSDDLRDEVFVKLGIKVVDGPQKAESWALVNPDDLRKEQELKASEKRNKELTKLENKRMVISKELTKFERLTGDSVDERTVLFGQYSQFDDEGIPIADDISASKRKNMKKELEKFRRDKDEFEKKGGNNFINELQAELRAIESKIADMRDD